MIARRCVLVGLLLVGLAGCKRQDAEPPAGLIVENVGGTLRYTNRLIAEKSPYLQQHAHNPVDWYPWGDEAFARARREGKPIFLSVGYSTCHWCHVMEAESFSNPEIADYMRRHFVSIKVDREERPDLDRVYQNYVIGVSEGGWPMSLFLTPDLKPFFGVNYVPPDDRDGEPGFRTILERVSAMWETRREEALRAAEEGTAALESRSRTTPGTGARADSQRLDEAFADISRSFDAASRGFGGAPRFPRPVVFAFLMRYHARTGEADALNMTLDTLRGMADGGLHDHLGGGFHRYATDPHWRVPHFEKMLYDQAQLATAYATAYQATHDPFFEHVARDVIDYVLDDLRDPAGAFMSAEDADSKAVQAGSKATEGAFYVWTWNEIQLALGADAALFAYHYGVDPDGNVPGALDSLGELTGRNVLSVVHTVADTAARFQRTPADTASILERSKRTMRAVRASRPRPSRDDKVLVAWNGLMMSALARSGAIFAEPAYLDAARAQAEFIQARMFDARDGTLTRRYRQGTADIDGLLEDYAFLIQGLLDLYEASFDAKTLAWAVRLQDTQDRLFLDTRDGGYFSTRAGAEHVLTRAKEEYDGAEPAANSVSAMNLIRLSQLTGRRAWRERAEGVFTALSPRLSRSGAALPQLLAALDYAHSRPRQIVVAGVRDRADTRAMLHLVHDRYIPNRILILAEGGTTQSELQKLVPFVEGLAPLHGRATIYICENYVCRLPTSDLTLAARMLDSRDTSTQR